MKSPFKETIAKWSAVLVFGLLYFTYRFSWYDLEQEKKARTLHEKGLICISIWHRNSVACLFAYAWRRLAILVSQSFDGEVIAFVGRAFGIHSARGSSTRGGSGAMRELIRLNREGYDIGITVDGPKGPIYKVKPGIIAIAARGGNPILPFAAVARRTWVLHKSWDNFRVPKPFSEILCVYGEPIVVGKKLEAGELEKIVELVESSLMNLEARLQLAIDKRTSPQAF